MTEPIDVVYTWVDSAQDGLNELIDFHARTPHDLNPNRYRCNVDLMRYSMRSLATYVPWIRNVYLLTARPQVPAWLKTDVPRVKVVHHDEIFDPAHLPTFNSFSILLHLHKIPGLSRRFLYVEDDRLFLRTVSPGDLFDDAGNARVYAKMSGTPRAGHMDARKTPWQAALAYSNHLLDERYGRKRRPSIKEAPMFIDREQFAAFQDAFPDAVARTKRSPFRAWRNIAPEHMYPYYLLHENRASLVPPWRSYRDVGYWSLDNFAPLTACGLGWVRATRPKFYALNDNFNQRPSPTAVHVVKRYLDSAYPTPGPLEQTPCEGTGPHRGRPPARSN